MSQRARFKAVESLEGSTNRAVVVCTDIAARGLDIPTVSTVVHYDVARSVDTFIHRSGRTAVSTSKYMAEGVHLYRYILSSQLGSCEEYT